MKFLQNNKGFTLIEIISAILVIGILAAVALPFFDTATIDVSVAGDTVQTDIQYVQELAMTRDQDVSITFVQNSGSYDVPADPNGVFPLETRDLPGGVIIQSGGTITFNSFGEKTAASAATIVLNASGNPITITIGQITGRATVS
jgi:prepilin-type N-terminal cleavage/methylation domain-containing protein